MEICTHARKVSLTTKISKLPVDERPRTHTRNSDVAMGFTKPDRPIITPKDKDGYRRPSSYNCPAFSRVDLGVVHRPYITYTLNGSGSNPWYRFEFSGDGFATLSSLDPPSPNVNALRSKLLNNVRQEVLDVAMVLAEMQGTVNTITNGLLRIGRSLSAVKRGNPRHFSYLLHGRTKDNRRPTDKFLRESSGLFLEWKYGIMPTVLDVAGACKAMDMNEDGSFWDNPPLLVGRASEKLNALINTNVAIGDASGFSEQVSVSLPTQVEYKARIDYSVRGEGLRGLNRYGIGLSSIPTVLFDRTPFSFVLNMALPISELIKAWTALQGCEVRGYCETLHKRVSFPKGSRTLSFGGIPCTATFQEQPDLVSWGRNAYPTVPMPMPYVRNPIKTGNLATVLALFTQLRKPSRS